MKKILITGGLGFIFSHVTEYFIRKGFDVYVIDNLSAGSHPELVPKLSRSTVNELNFKFIRADMSFPSVVPMIEEINPDYIIHAAANSDVDSSIKNPTSTILANNQASLHAFEAARKCSRLERFLYVSTDEVYGECDHAKSEEDIIFPRNPYALTKAFGSLMRLTYDNTYPELHDKTVETRFCNVFGPRQDDRKILPALMRAINGGGAVQLHNGGLGYRQFIHVSEIPPVIDLLLEKGHRTYNITSAEGCTIMELVEMVAKISGRSIATLDASRPGMDMRYEMSPARMYSEFGWKPQRSFEESLKEYVYAHIA